MLEIFLALFPGIPSDAPCFVRHLWHGVFFFFCLFSHQKWVLRQAGAFIFFEFLFHCVVHCVCYSIAISRYGIQQGKKDFRALVWLSTAVQIAVSLYMMLMS